MTYNIPLILNKEFTVNRKRHLEALILPTHRRLAG